VSYPLSRKTETSVIENQNYFENGGFFETSHDISRPKTASQSSYDFSFISSVLQIGDSTSTVASFVTGILSRTV
jgi:hypothetical protein